MVNPPIRRQWAGFTLLELTIVIILVGLLASIAVPAYKRYVTTAYVHRAIADIGSIALDLKRWELATLRYPDTLAEAGLGGRLDPWGNEYRYLNLEGANIGAARKDRNLVPINTNFDLYSVGADGNTQTPLVTPASRDDIILANDGSFIGLAEDY